MYNGSYNTRGYRAKHTTIPKARRIKDRSFRAHPRLVVVPCVRLLYEAAPFLPSPSPDLFASARRSARLRFASFLRTRKHSRHVFSSPSKSRNTSSAFRQLLQNRLGRGARPHSSVALLPSYPHYSFLILISMVVTLSSMWTLFQRWAAML